MSIPFYFAAEENEALPQKSRRYAQLGFGFHEDGSLRLPERSIPGAPAVINDRFLPAKAPGSSVLDTLAEACASGCFLDFERPVSEVSAAIAVGLQRRLRAKMTVPRALRSLCPEADVQIPGLLCNNWERFVRDVRAEYGDRWVLEIIPWRRRTPFPVTGSLTGCLRTALCDYRVENGSATFYDTEASVKEKLAIAERYGCQAGITLLREYEQISQFEHITKSAQFR